ncbi:MAG: glycosyltransferase [bacterium]
MEKINRVVLAGNFLFPSGSASAKRMQNLALGLAEMGTNVHVLPLAPICVSEGGAARTYRLGPNVTCEPMATTHRPVPARNPLCRKPLWFLRTYGAALRAYWRLRELVKAGRCDLLIAYGRSMIMLAPLVSLCRTHGLPALLDVVELHSQFNGFGGRASPIYWDWYLGQRILPHWFDGLLIIAQGLRSVYEDVGVTQFLRVPAIEDWDDAQAGSKTRPNRTPFHLVCVTKLIERDAPGVLLEAMRFLSMRQVPIQLNLLGKFREVPGSRRWVRLCEKDPHLRQVVNLVGRVSDESLMRHFSRADGFVLTRRDARPEMCSFPTRLVEYLKTGRPVLVSAVGDIPDYLRDGVDAIFLSPDDSAQVAQVIADVAANPARARDIGRRGRCTGARVFDRTTHAARILEFAEGLRKAKATGER